MIRGARLRDDVLVLMSFTMGVNVYLMTANWTSADVQDKVMRQDCTSFSQADYTIVSALVCSRKKMPLPKLVFVTASTKRIVPGVIGVMLTVVLCRKGRGNHTDVVTYRFFFREVVAEQSIRGLTLAEAGGIHAMKS